LNKKAKTLLHCCCAPCASYVLECLIPQNDVTLFFYNPNIEPRSEYYKRRDELPTLLKKASLTTKVKLLGCEYDNAVFRNMALSLCEEPEGGVRCRVCLELRLAETARQAVAGEYNSFATTLTVSPHKDALLINEIGYRLAKKHGIKYQYSDFKKCNGYNRSVELSKEYGLYRQSYCGCAVSMPEI